MDERYIDVEISILNDLNHLRTKYDEIDYEGYIKASKEMFDFSKYKKIGNHKIDVSLTRLLDNGHIQYKTGQAYLPKYENLNQGLFGITDYGRTMIDLNNFSNHIYQIVESTSNDWKKQLEQLNKTYFAQIITIFGLFIAVFSFIISASRDTLSVTIPITKKSLEISTTLGAAIYWQVILLKAIALLPLALILLIFIVILYFLFRR